MNIKKISFTVFSVALLCISMVFAMDKKDFMVLMQQPQQQMRQQGRSLPTRNLYAAMFAERERMRRQRPQQQMQQQGRSLPTRNLYAATFAERERMRRQRPQQQMVQQGRRRVPPGPGLPPRMQQQRVRSVPPVILGRGQRPPITRGQQIQVQPLPIQQMQLQPQLLPMPRVSPRGRHGTRLGMQQKPLRRRTGRRRRRGTKPDVMEKLK